ncbi:hypothetical protein [Acetobacter persici]|uniref:Uncharacterized protein n=1 Tax=Acetobacter persici TaxID=1076596 RepID=A0A6V8IE11_9PROT|nr:hypothetical protein [Acetobacter persici]GFE94826.1 hypothetical protein DmAi_28850 [Acetobacter persici]
MTPLDIMLVCGAILGTFGGGAGLVSLGRHRGLSDRVQTLEDDIKHSLRDLKQDGERTRELLHVIVRGHMADKS